MDSFRRLTESESMHAEMTTTHKLMNPHGLETRPLHKLNLSFEPGLSVQDLSEGFRLARLDLET